jgi:heat shock protein HtpX
MARPSTFGRDTGLQARMVLTLFLLGAVYAVLIGVLFAAGASGVTILVVAGGLLALQFFASDQLALRSMGAHEVSPQEAPQLHALIERLCVQADLPKPRIYIMETSMPNAFAIGRSQKKAAVCATTGILELLSPSELEGVMAHELTHIINRDVMVMTLASFFASLASMIVQFGFFFGGGYSDSDSDDDGPGFMVVILVSVVVYFVSFLLMQALSRYREFAADRGSAVITGRPSALSSALLKISGAMQRTPTEDLRVVGEMNAFFIVPASVKNSLFNLFATHPPMEKRIEALSRLEAQLQSGARPVAA